MDLDGWWGEADGKSDQNILYEILQELIKTFT